MKWRIILILLVSWAFLTLQISAPWSFHHDFNGLMVTEMVRNYSIIPIVGPKPYTHHPPMIGWISTITAAFTGSNEMSLRFVVGSSTLVSIAALYALVRAVWDERIAVWVAALYSFTPMILFFGRMPGHEAPSLAIIMLYAAALVRREWLVTSVLAVAAALTSWAAILFVGMLTLAAFPLVRQKKWLVAAGSLTFVTLVALLGFYEWQVPGAIWELGSAFLHRSSNASHLPQSEPFTLIQFLTRNAVHMGLLITPGVLLLGSIGLGLGLRARGWPRAVLGAMLAGALGYILLLRNAAYIHDYYKIYFSAPMAMGAALVVVRAQKRGRLAVIGALILSAVVGGFMMLSLHVLNRGLLSTLLIGTRY